jgi:hypothetical protein
LADKDGWTVAHEAAMFGYLPSDFDYWEWTDINEKTVSEIDYSFTEDFSL